MNLRPSNLGLALACGQSLSDDISVEQEDDAARLGTAVHAWIDEEIATGNAPSPRHYAAIHHVNADDCAILCHQSWECWEQLQGSFPDPKTEVRLEDAGELNLGGTLDLLSIVEDLAAVIDWKSGRTEDDHGEQARAYGYLALQAHPECTHVSVTIVHVREREADTQTYTREELDRWYRGCVRRIQDGKGIYRPGEHCSRCPRAVGCPARMKMLACAATSMSGVEWCTKELSDVDLVRTIKAVRMMKAHVESAASALKVEVELRGTLDTPEGVAEIRTEQRQTIEPKLAYETLVDAIGLDFVDCIKISKSAVEDAIAKSAVRGKRKTAIRRVMDALEAAGAIVPHTIEKLVVRKSMKPLEWIDGPAIAAIAESLDKQIADLRGELQAGAKAIEFRNQTAHRVMTEPFIGD